MSSFVQTLPTNSDGRTALEAGKKKKKHAVGMSWLEIDQEKYYILAARHWTTTTTTTGLGCSKSG